MSGYLGNPDAEAEHANVLSENGVEASRRAMQGSIREYCLDTTCGVRIPDARREAARQAGMKCWYCIDCQMKNDMRGGPRIRMLDRIL